MAILKDPSNEFGNETSCQQIQTSYYLPVYRQLKWIQRYAGRNMCTGEPENDFSVEPNVKTTKNYNVLIAVVCLLFVYMLTLTSLIWMEFNKNGKIVENVKGSSDEIQSQEEISQLSRWRSTSQLNLEKAGGSQIDVKSEENGSQLRIKQNKDESWLSLKEVRKDSEDDNQSEPKGGEEKNWQEVAKEAAEELDLKEQRRREKNLI